MAAIDVLLRRMTEVDASDLHLKVGVRPRYRIDGLLEEFADQAVVDAASLERMTTEILSSDQLKLYGARGELDFAYGDRELGRHRCNYFRDHWGPAAVFRRIAATVPTLAQLGLPEQIERFAHLKRGLVLVTGATGSGKSSTMAALIDLINRNYRRHIITLEDPIEYVHNSRRSLVHQRGMHYDITDFASGIRDASRESPDVLLIGEMRDLDSIRQTLSAAEVGTLVFATLHTNSAAGSVDRIVDVFPTEVQPEIRIQLSQSLAGIVSQVLLRRSDTDGRIPATEILVSNPAVGNIIRDGRSQDLVSVLQSGASQGMHTLDDSLERLVKQGKVDPQEAFLHATNKARFERLLAQRRGSAAQPARAR